MAVTANPNIIMGFQAPQITNPMAIAAQGEQIRSAQMQNKLAQAQIDAMPAKAQQAFNDRALKVGKAVLARTGSASEFNKTLDSVMGGDASAFHIPDDETFQMAQNKYFPQRQGAKPVDQEMRDARLELIRRQTELYGQGKAITPEQQRLNDLKAKDLESKITARTTATPPPSNEPIFEAETVLADLADLKAADLSEVYGKGESLYPDIARKQANVDLMAKRDRIVNLTSLESRSKLKGQGTITDQESAMLAKASTILNNPEISPELVLEEIARVEAIFQRSRDRAAQRAGINNPVKTPQLSPDDIAAKQWAEANPNDPRAQAILNNLQGNR